MNTELINKIKVLKEEKNALILAHYYQPLEVQLAADFVGDSFDLSRKAAATDKPIIVFCGVSFMAESAKILSPDKKVLLSATGAGCPMADMITAKKIRELRREHPDAAVVCYVNSSAEVKAESDVCCTSSNAYNVVKNLKNKEIIFVPDKNLGSFVAEKLPEKEFFYIDGYCPIHNFVTLEELNHAKSLHPEALVAIHPECPREVVEKADMVGSTKEIIAFAIENKDKGVIIATENGVVDRLKYMEPDGKFYPLKDGFICENMKKTTLTELYETLKNESNMTNLSEEQISNARLPLEKMIATK